MSSMKSNQPGDLLSVLRVTLPFLIVILPLFWGSGCREEHVELEQIALEQSSRYPEISIEDWYKLLHQGAMGNRHLGVDDSLIYNYLLGEWDRITASAEEPLVEIITPDSAVVRLNLRPFKAGGGDPDVLFESMKRSWDTIVPSTEQLENYASQLRVLAESGKIGVGEEEIDRFFSEKKGEGYPAVHHSPLYESSYAPAYRVLHRDVVPRLD